MSWVEQTVAEFGRGLGLDRLEFNPQGVVTLATERMGTLFIERVDGAVLVYLVQPLDRASAESYARALDACHWRHNHPFQVSAGLRQETGLLFAVRVIESDFDLPTLERVISLLDELHREVREGVPA